MLKKDKRNPRRPINMIPVGEIWTCRKCKKKYKRTSTLSIRKHAYQCVKRKYEVLRSPPISPKEEQESPKEAEEQESPKAMDVEKIEVESQITSHYPFKDELSPLAMLVL